MDDIEAPMLDDYTDDVSVTSGHTTRGGPDDDVKEGGLPKFSKVGDYLDDDYDDSGEISLQTSESSHKNIQIVKDNSQTFVPAQYSKMASCDQNSAGVKVCKALFDYPGGYRKHELTFHRGTNLIITKEKDGWVYGHYELEPSLVGWFPNSYVTIVSE